MNDQQVCTRHSAPAEPDPRAWLTPAKRQLILDQTKNIEPLLRQAGLWRATLSYWVRWQASLEAGWSKKEEEECIDQLFEKWQHQKDTTNNKNFSSLDETTLRNKLRVAPAVAYLARNNGNISWIHYI